MKFQLSNYGLAFMTRPSGQKMYTILIAEASDQKAKHVQIDFADLKVVGFSFVDEFIGTLFTCQQQGELLFTFEVINTSSVVERALALSYKNRRTLLQAA